MKNIFKKEKAVKAKAVEPVVDPNACDNCTDGLVGDPTDQRSKVCEVCGGTGKK